MHKELQIQKVEVRASNKPRDLEVFQMLIDACVAPNKAAIMYTIRIERDSNISASTKFTQTN